MSSSYTEWGNVYHTEYTNTTSVHYAVVCAVSNCTQIWSWLVIMWMLSDIITISFNLHLKGHSCIYTTNLYRFTPNIKLYQQWIWLSNISTSNKPPPQSQVVTVDNSANTDCTVNLRIQPTGKQRKAKHKQTENRQTKYSSTNLSHPKKTLTRKQTQRISREYCARMYLIINNLCQNRF